jgi:hypothetical protein
MSATNGIWIYTFQHILSIISDISKIIDKLIIKQFRLSSVILFQLKELEVFILKEIKVRFQMNDIYYSPKIRMNLLLFIKLFRQSGIIGIWEDIAILSTRDEFKFCEIQYHEDFWKIKHLLSIISIICVSLEVVFLSISAISTNKSSPIDI